MPVAALFTYQIAPIYGQDSTDVPEPTSFRAAFVSQDGVALTWLSALGAEGYELEYRKEGDDGSWTSIQTGDFDSLPSSTPNRRLLGVATDLDCDAQYEFRVRARIGENYSDYVKKTATTGGTIGIVGQLAGYHCPREEGPSNVRVSREPSQATITWTAPTSSDIQFSGYRVFRTPKVVVFRHNLELLAELDFNTTTYIDDSSEYKTAGSVYSYHVTAVSPIPGIQPGAVDDQGTPLPTHTEHDLASGERGTHGAQDSPQEPRNVRFTQESSGSRTLLWVAPPSHHLIIERAYRGQSAPATDPWTTGFQVDRREYVFRGGQKHLVQYTKEGDGREATEDGWEIMRNGTEGVTSASFTDLESAGTKTYVYRVRTVNSRGISSGYESYDWVWMAPVGGL